MNDDGTTQHSIPVKGQFGVDPRGKQVRRVVKIIKNY